MRVEQSAGLRAQGPSSGESSRAAPCAGEPVPRQVRLAPDALETIRAHARSAYPAECCGFLLGRRADGHACVHEARPAVNRLVAAARHGYVISPSEYLTTERAAEGRGLEMLGFYHSHPDQSPAPSALDLHFAWPNTVYLVASVQDGTPRGMGAFVLSTGRGALEAVTIVEDPHG